MRDATGDMRRDYVQRDVLNAAAARAADDYVVATGESHSVANFANGHSLKSIWTIGSM